LIGRSSIPETAVIDREATAYWIPRAGDDNRGWGQALRSSSLPSSLRGIAAALQRRCVAISKGIAELERPSDWRVFSERFHVQGENNMFAKSITAGLAASALLAAVAFAQTPTATTDRANMAPAAASDQSFRGDWRASKVVGLSVYNDNNESIGSINDLLMDKNGNIKAVVIGVGGFLGVGSHLVAIPFEKMKFVNEPIAYTGVAGAPNAPGNRPPSSTTTGSATTSTAPASAPQPKPNPWYPDHAVFNATKDELKAMPEFKYST
jgi:sporulation protein YlmC with PRC-barrel domain